MKSSGCSRFQANPQRTLKTAYKAAFLNPAS